MASRGHEVAAMSKGSKGGWEWEENASSSYADSWSYGKKGAGGDTWAVAGKKGDRDGKKGKKGNLGKDGGDSWGKGSLSSEKGADYKWGKGGGDSSDAGCARRVAMAVAQRRRGHGQDCAVYPRQEQPQP